MNERHTPRSKTEPDEKKPTRGTPTPPETPPRERDYERMPDRTTGDDRSRRETPVKRGGDDPTTDW